ncbi:hypothetical protein ABEB36_012750 [Hypothenemus hampei]|uniref:Uncharacterized protein n=1 Tax=Hypothenemus hampei TaxID=57062 RepID=A0ABD1ECA0_HYPHA
MDTYLKTPYIKPCSRSSPDFKKCCVNHGNEALPALLKGDNRLKLPSMTPLTFPKVEVNAGPNLKLSFNDANFYGLETIQLLDMDVDFGQQTMEVKLKSDRISVIGQYDVDGKIMVLPLTGKGPENITIINTDFVYKMTYTTTVKNGKAYVKPAKDDLKWKIAKAYFQLDNLFNGNVQMGDNVNKFLNDNDQDVLKELGGAVTEVIRIIARTVADALFSSTPLDEIFLA